MSRRSLHLASPLLSRSTISTLLQDHSRASHSLDYLQLPPWAPTSAAAFHCVCSRPPHSLEHARLYGDLWTVLVKAPTTSATAGTITFRSFFDACSSPLRQRVRLPQISTHPRLAAATPRAVTAIHRGKASACHRVY
jgi:hypothetical protein